MGNPDGRFTFMGDAESQNRKSGPGITSQVVGRNVARLRGGSGLSARELAERATALGASLSQSGISDIENGRRTVSVDQLTVLAILLDVSPLSLLMPETYAADLEAPRLAGTPEVLGGDLLDWLRADAPLDSLTGVGEAEAAIHRQMWQRRALPPWSWAALT